MTPRATNTKAPKAPPIAEFSHRSHYVTIGNRLAPPIEKEEVFLTFRTEWRGKPVSVEVEARRYSSGFDRDAQTLREWTAFARTPEFIAEDGDQWRRIGHASDVARSRLGDVVVPLALAWIGSDDYRASEQRAYVGAVRREFNDVDRYGTGRVRRTVDAFGDKLGAESADKFRAACDAYDDYAEKRDALLGQ